jgi:acyl-CoA thioester hydrolase
VASSGIAVNGPPDAAPVSEASFPVRARSYELDSYAHLNNAVYQSWFEEGREELLRRGGLDYDWFPRTLGLWFVVARTELDFRISLGRREEASVESRIVRIGERSVTWRQVLRRADGAVFAAARTVMCFGKDGRAEPVPAVFRERFAAHPAGDAAF